MKKLLFLSMVLLVSGNVMNAAASSYRVKGEEIVSRKLFAGAPKWGQLLEGAYKFWKGDRKYAERHTDLGTLPSEDLLPFADLTDEQRAPLALYLNYLHQGLNFHEDRLRALEDAQ